MVFLKTTLLSGSARNRLFIFLENMLKKPSLCHSGAFYIKIESAD